MPHVYQWKIPCKKCCSGFDESVLPHIPVIITHNMLGNEITVWCGWHFYFFLQEDKEKWLAFQKKKWEFQSKQRAERKRLRKEADTMGISTLAVGRGPSTGLSTFMRQQARSLVDTPWQIIQVRFCIANECDVIWTCLWFMLLSSLYLMRAQAKICWIQTFCFYPSFKFAETNDPGTFKVWALVGADLHAIKVNVPRIFYVNCHTPKEGAGTSKLCPSTSLDSFHRCSHLRCRSLRFDFFNC